MKNDEAVKIIDSIKGLGPWTAVILRLEYGSIERFYSADAAVAYAGLDPRIDQSGDITRNPGISLAGRKQIRKALYMPTLAAIRFNPIIQNFHNRLVAAGKRHQLAVIVCMRKLIRLVYACWITRQTLRSQFSKTKTHSKKTIRNNAFGRRHPLFPDGTYLKKRSKKRKAAALPQNGINHLMRGPGAATDNNGSSRYRVGNFTIL